ncbi:3-oxoacyl-[acyl-carrier-protein] reductase [Peptostreptococcaceae bacterium AGR-M142]
MELKGKNILITGASRGIGKAIALVLAKLGANIAINYTSNEAKALEVKEEVEKNDVKAITLKADVSKMEEAEAMVKETIKELGSVDVLINNAGITRDTLLMRMKEEDFSRVLEINLTGAFNCTKAVTRPMMKQKAGKIINMSSVVGLTGNAGQANYAASKAGLIGFSKSVARELATRNICVNVVAPGFIDTDMTDVLKDDVKESILSNIPMNKMGQAQDVANLVAFLASDMSNYITGQVINVDGGFVMQ